MNIKQLLDQSAAQDQHKSDYPTHPHQINFDNNSIMQVTGNSLFANASVALNPTDWAWRQMFAKLAKSVYGKGENKTLPADYLLALRADLRAHVLNDHCRNYPNGNWLVRAFDDNCRAVLSDQYAAISNTELLAIVEKIAGETSAPSRLTDSTSVTPDSLNMRMIWKDIARPDQQNGNGGWGIGVAITNGETGQRKLRGMPLLQRHSCQNSIVVDQQVNGFEFTHRGSVSTKMIVVKSAMQEILPFAAELLERMIAADSQQIPDFTSVLDGLAIQYNWDDQTKTNVAVGTEGRDTKAGIINGVTHAAKFAQTDDDRMDMEILGGRLLVGNDSVFARAAQMAYAQR